MDKESLAIQSKSEKHIQSNKLTIGSHRKHVAVAIVILVLLCVAAYAFNRSPPLGRIEKQLVGTWRAKSEGKPDGHIYQYVFRDDRSMSGEIFLRGTIPSNKWDDRWKIVGKDLIIYPQGFEIPLSLNLKSIFRQSPSIPILSIKDDEIMLDSGGQEHSVLIRIK